MSLSRCIFVYCEHFKKGFVTRLTQEQKFDKIYEQVTELFLKETNLEVKHVELLGSRPSVDWIVPPFFRVKDFGDLSFEDSIYVRATFQPKTNDERRSEIRATATYKRSKGSSKRKMTTKGVEELEKVKDALVHVEEGTEEEVHFTKAAKKVKESDPAEVTANEGPTPERTVSPPAVREGTHQTTPIAESSITSEKKERPMKKRLLKNGKPKVKVSKSTELSEKKHKLKQSTLTPSSHTFDETQVQTETSKENTGGEKKKKKTPPPQETPKKELDPDEDDESSSDESTSTDNDSDSHVRSMPLVERTVRSLFAQDS